jgi:cobalamin biosynthesis Mg chelatase CobN
MKTKLLFLVLAVLFAVTSCKTTKQVAKTDIESSTAANVKTQTSDQINLNIDQKTENKQAVDSSKTIVDKGSVNETTEETTVTVIYSVPDASGKQHKQTETTTTKVVKRGENKNLKVDKESSSKSDRATELRDRSDYKSDSAAADKSKTKSNDKSRLVTTSETPTPGWVYVVILVVAVLVAGFVYLVLKRYNIIK